MPTKIQQKKIAAKILQKLGKQLFNEAQKLAPSNSGALKNAGDWYMDKNNIVISYDISYAYELHEGWIKGDLKLPPTLFPAEPWTKGHWRRLGPSHKVWVSRHQKKYTPYYKPVEVAKGKWRTVNYESTSDREGTKWVQKAWDKVLSRQPQFLREFLPENLIITENNK